jgi:peptidoglycan/LPS O-acetylase OafA/YrhL
VAFKLSMHVRPTWPAATWPLLLLCLTLLYLVWPKPSVGAAGCLVLSVCQPRIRELRWPALRIVSQPIASYSYGVYLTHLICMWFAFDFLSGAPWAIRWATFATTTIAVPVALYHGLEHPMIALGGQLASKLRRRELQKIVFS